MKTALLTCALLFSAPAFASHSYRCAPEGRDQAVMTFQVRTATFGNRLSAVRVMEEGSDQSVPDLEFGSSQIFLEGSAAPLGRGPLGYQFMKEENNPRATVVMVGGGFLTPAVHLKTSIAMVEDRTSTGALSINDKTYRCRREQ